MKRNTFLKVFGTTTLGLITIVGCAASSGEESSDSTSSDITGGGPVPAHVGIMKWTDPGAPPKNTAAPSGAKLTYYGGRVISNVEVIQVLWGTGSYLSQVSSTASPSIATFYGGVTNSAYFDWLTEYNTPTGTKQTIGHGSFKGQFTITPSTTASTIDDSVIQTELTAQIKAGHLPAPTSDAAGNTNTYYAVFFPHGKKITQGGSASCASGGFCAYHGTVKPSSGAEFYYGVHPDMQAGSGCETGCGNGTAFGNITSVASHELVEAVTDPEVGISTVVGAPLAWYDTTNGEIGDICNAQQGSVVGADGVTYTVQQEYSNAAKNCITTSGVVKPPTDAGTDGSSDGGKTDGGTGTCKHSDCVSGTKLAATCDACVSQICAADSYCCKTSWDSICVGEVSSICNKTCP